MVGGLFHAQVLIAFTGDEERKSRGAKQVIKELLRRSVFWNAELVVVMDVTKRGYKKAQYTLENISVEADNKGSVLQFQGKGALRRYLKSFLTRPMVVKRAAPDEAKKFENCDFNVVSFCLPVKGKMHGKRGLKVRKDSLARYQNALVKLVNGVASEILRTKSEDVV